MWVFIVFLNIRSKKKKEFPSTKKKKKKIAHLISDLKPIVNKNKKLSIFNSRKKKYY